MKIVLDANIFVSSYFWRGNPRTIVNRLIDGPDMLFITDDIVNEIKRTIRKPKFSATAEQINEFITGIEELGQKVTVSPQHKISGVCWHPKDEKYLECALAAKADYIITGDNDLLTLKKHHNTEIITAKEYLEIVNSICDPFYSEQNQAELLRRARDVENGVNLAHHETANE